MNNRPEKKVWVAVRIQRGFVSDIRAFEEREFALRQERRWRRVMNPDYDETGIGKVKIVSAKTSTRRKMRP